MSDDETIGGILRGLAHAPAAALPPETIGRFKVTRTLGSGGMGVVYEAEDPTLGRKVAIKLLRAERDGEAADAAASRLLREAQALARLSHPNVVTIYEAGRDGDRVYLAMELVVGATARAWRDAAPRTTDEILAVYRQAAIGLAAAHGAGLVHRDVKPENLLVGDDGRVRVTDFGLVAALEHGPVTGHDAREVDPEGLTMTRTGAVMGTPPYMPPEAHRAEPVDARGDQWSLCVAIWEALGGARPYAGATYQVLVANILGDRRVDPPTRLPDRVRATLERGLAVDPAARWPSVMALMDALTHRSRRGLALGAGALVAVGLGAVAYVQLRSGGAAVSAADAGPVDAAAVVEAPPEPFTTGGGCARSPFFVDAQTVGVEVGHGALSDIVAIPLDGGAPTPISVLPEQNFYPVRGAHDGEIAFFHRGAKPGPGTWITRVDRGGEPHILEGPVDFNTRAAFAIVGDAVYYNAPEWRFLRRYREGVDDVQVAELPLNLGINRIVASRDGRWLALGTRTSHGPCLVDLAASPVSVECLDTGSSGGVAFSFDDTALYRGTGEGIWRLDLATRRETQVSRVPVWNGLTVSSDERTLIVSQCYARGRTVEVRADGTLTERADDALWDPAIGPDGLLVAVRTDEHGDAVVERDRDGTWRELVAPGLDPSEPVLDSTGRYVAFVSSRDPGIFVVSNSAFAPDRLTDGETDQTPVFLDDGRVVFTRFGDDRRSHVFVVDPAGGEPTQANDRVRYVLDFDRATHRVLLRSGDNHRLFLWDPATDRETPVPTGDLGEIFAASLSADGATLVIQNNREVRRMRMSPATTPELVYASEAVRIDRPVVTGDGVVTFSVWEPSGELVRVRR